MASLFSNLGRGLSNVTKRAGANLMPTPEGGLLSDEDVSRARRQGMLHLGLSLLGDTSGNGLGPALANAIPAGKQAYQGAAQDVLTQRQLVRQEQDMAKQEKMLVERERIMGKYRLSPDSTPEQIFEQFPKMYAELMSAGDTEGAKQLQSVVQQMIPDKPKEQLFQAGGSVVRVKPGSNELEQLGSIPISPDQLREAELDRELKRANIGLLAAQRDAVRQSAADTRIETRGEQIGKVFQSQNRRVLESEYKYAQWKAALGEAQAGEPAAFKSALINFINIADPGAQIRLGMVQFLAELDASVPGNWARIIAAKTGGRHPAYLLASMDRHVNAIHKSSIETYDNMRTKRLKALNQPAYEKYFPAVEEAFPSYEGLRAQEGSGASGTPSSSRASQFLSGGQPEEFAAPIAPARPTRPYAQPNRFITPPPRADARPNPFMSPLDPNAGSMFPRR